MLKLSQGIPNGAHLLVDVAIIPKTLSRWWILELVTISYTLFLCSVLYNLRLLVRIILRHLTPISINQNVCFWSLLKLTTCWETLSHCVNSLGLCFRQIAPFRNCSFEICPLTKISLNRLFFP